ncbi:MAG: HIT domain-containing protein, partial [Devosia sp.]
MSYDDSNIFAKILRGEIPSVKVFEDETILVMMDLFPQSKGHTLVIPKAASRNLLDADADEVAKAAAYLPWLARAVKAATGADGIKLAQF